MPNGQALNRAGELAELYLKVPRLHVATHAYILIQPLKERVVREVGYGFAP